MIVVIIFVLSTGILLSSRAKNNLYIYSPVHNPLYLDKDTRKNIKLLPDDKLTVLRSTTDNMGEKVTNLLINFPKTMPVTVQSMTYSAKTDAIVISAKTASENDGNTSVYVCFGDTFYPEHITVYVDGEAVDAALVEVSHDIFYDAERENH